jgi:hypothetical protein
MTEKPTYEELERKIKKLEKEAREYVRYYVTRPIVQTRINGLTIPGSNIRSNFSKLKAKVI